LRWHGFKVSMGRLPPGPQGAASTLLAAAAKQLAEPRDHRRTVGAMALLLTGCRLMPDKAAPIQILCMGMSEIGPMTPLKNVL
jgi:hypothetical protein